MINSRWFNYKKNNKYNAKREAGFGSKLEAEVYKILKLREKAGQIQDLCQQQRVDLSCNIFWKVDFSFVETATNRRVWAEAKGVETERYRLCLKLWKGGHGPGKLEIWKGHYTCPRLIEIVEPIRRSK